MPGYPDFQASPQQRGDALLSVFKTAVAVGGTTLLPFTNLTNYSYLTLVGSPFVQNVTLSATFKDQGTSQQFIARTLVASSQFTYQVPMLLPSVQLSATAAGANATLSLYAAPTNIPVAPGDVNGDGFLFFGSTGPVASLGTADVVIGGGPVGPATISVDATQANFVVRQRELNMDTTTLVFQPLVVDSISSAHATWDTWLYPHYTVFRIGNLAGTNTTFTVSVSMKTYSGHGA